MGGFVRQEPQKYRWANTAAAGTALTNSTAETVLGTFTIRKNSLRSGTRIHFKYQGIISATTGATTLAIKARMGSTTLTGTALITGTATTTAASLIYSGEFDLIARADPSTTSALVGHGLFCEPTAAGAVTPKQALLASTNFDTTVDQLIEITGTWSAADANSTRLDILIVETFGPTVQNVNL